MDDNEVANDALVEHGAGVPFKKALEPPIQMSADIARKYTVTM